MPRASLLSCCPAPFIFDPRGGVIDVFLDDCYFNGLTSSLVTKSTSSVHNIVHHILVSTRFKIFALTAREISYMGREIIGKGELSGNMFE